MCGAPAAFQEWRMVRSWFRVPRFLFNLMMYVMWQSSVKPGKILPNTLEKSFNGWESTLQLWSLQNTSRMQECHGSRTICTN